jgi:proteasome lid subunit RPN8/RPN11
MSQNPTGPTTPVLVKSTPDIPWPEGERVFYLVGREGLFICRNGEFFRSCVPAARGPSALASQAPFLTPRFPPIPRSLFERVVGFFDRIAELHGSEAAAMLVWDRRAERVRLVVPEQTATVYRAWDGYRSAIGVHYLPPTDLPVDWIPFGDVHSHVHMAAYASGTDVADETHAAGLHIVVGRIQKEPPEIHVEAVVDGTRFHLDVRDVIVDYRKRRRNVPQEWIDRVTLEEQASYVYSGSVS